MLETSRGTIFGHISVYNGHQASGLLGIKVQLYNAASVQAGRTCESQVLIQIHSGMNCIVRLIYLHMEILGKTVGRECLGFRE